MRRVVRTAPVAPIGWPCDRAPFDIDDAFRQTELAHHDDRDRRKGLVDLDAVDITEFPPGAVERLTHRRDRSKAEQSRLNGGDAVGYEARCRVETPAFREILICQHYRSSPTVEAGRIAGGNRAVRTKSRFQHRQCRQRCFRPITFVRLEHGWTLPPGQFNRNNFMLELAGCLRRRKALLGAQCPPIHAPRLPCASSDIRRR